MIAAATRAGIDAEIMTLPQGYDTLLGQGGVDLSAGQKQRLGIARAILRQPDILVLDESTSSLDLATERRVLDSLLSHRQDMTIIAITHRASVADRMERTIVLQPQLDVARGRLDEIGFLTSVKVSLARLLRARLPP